MKKLLFLSAILFAFTTINAQDTCACPKKSVTKKHSETKRNVAGTGTVIVTNVDQTVEQTPAITQTVTVNVPSSDKNGSGDWWKVLIAVVVVAGLIWVGTSLRSGRRTNETDVTIIDAVGRNGGRLQVSDGNYKYNLFMNAPSDQTVTLHNGAVGRNQQQAS